ncbi:MAG: nucleotidyltransferase domain-containing protein [Kofleriaceae bacterium]
MRDPWSVLTPLQCTVARAFIAERERERAHLVVYLSGAHAYGFPSPDSDLDLKSVHISPTSELVRLAPLAQVSDRVEVIDGVELDYGSNELAAVLRGAIKGNGNFLERILGELVLGGDEVLLAEARRVVRPLLSRRVARHYAGFAASQLRLFDDKPTAKRALYVLRTTATGRHALIHGEIVTDVTRLTELLPHELDELLEFKRRGEQQLLAPEAATRWRERLVAAIAAVDRCWPSSVLPEEPGGTAIEDADAWLLEVRRTHWGYVQPTVRS